MTLTYGTATTADKGIVKAQFDEAAAWLAGRGIDQWNPAAMADRETTKEPGRSLADQIKRGDVYLVRDDGDLIGSIIHDDYADPEFWSDADSPDDALYMHRMIVTRAASGRNIGAAMIDWASGQVANAGRRWLRLGAWLTNTALHDYYRRLGFEHVRSVDLPWRPSGALFQRPVTSATSAHC